MLGRELGEAQAERLAGASALHLRRPSSLEAIVDQGMNTALGLTAPPRAWPWQAHARGMAAHAVYGAALGLLLGSGERTR